jgi:hypothetical protein
MDVAAWLVWRKTGFCGTGLALVLFVVWLVLNVLWSYLFLGLNRPDVAFADIEALWTAIPHYHDIVLARGLGRRRTDGTLRRLGRLSIMPELLFYGG